MNGCRALPSQSSLLCPLLGGRPWLCPFSSGRGRGRAGALAQRGQYRQHPQWPPRSPPPPTPSGALLLICRRLSLFPLRVAPGGVSGGKVLKVKAGDRHLHFFFFFWADNFRLLYQLQRERWTGPGATKQRGLPLSPGVRVAQHPEQPWR